MKNKIWLLFLLPALILMVAAAWSRGIELRLEDAASGDVLFRQAVGTGRRFSIIFNHSVAKSDVEEIFEITGRDEFRLRETVYADFGAGLPHEELPGQRMTVAGGRIRLSGYDTRFGELILRVGYVADHRLVMEGAGTLRLSDLARPGTAVRITLG